MAKRIEIENRTVVSLTVCRAGERIIALNVKSRTKHLTLCLCPGVLQSGPGFGMIGSVACRSGVRDGRWLIRLKANRQDLWRSAFARFSGAFEGVVGHGR